MKRSHADFMSMKQPDLNEMNAGVRPDKGRFHGQSSRSSMQMGGSNFGPRAGPNSRHNEGTDMSFKAFNHFLA